MASIVQWFFFHVQLRLMFHVVSKALVEIGESCLLFLNAKVFLKNIRAKDK